jgi:hypothetical protein
LWLDLKIVFMTINNVIKRKNIAISTGGFDGTN